MLLVEAAALYKAREAMLNKVNGNWKAQKLTA